MHESQREKKESPEIISTKETNYLLVSNREREKKKKKRVVAVMYQRIRNDLYTKSITKVRHFLHCNDDYSTIMFHIEIQVYLI
jgi:hypothetical protein